MFLGMSVCLFVHQIARKVANRFWWNFWRDGAEGPKDQLDFDGSLDRDPDADHNPEITDWLDFGGNREWSWPGKGH